MLKARWISVAFSARLNCNNCVDGKPPNYQPSEPESTGIPGDIPIGRDAQGNVITPSDSTGTTESTDDTAAEEDDAGTDDTSSDDDGSAPAPSSSSSSTSECSASTQNNVFLELTDPSTDRYQPADDWTACCALCNDDSACYAWCAGRGGAGRRSGRHLHRHLPCRQHASARACLPLLALPPPCRRRSWSPENKRCDGGPCCFFRGETGYTVIDKPNDGTGLADRVSGVFGGGAVPAAGTTV